MTDKKRKPILSLCATTRDELRNLAVKNGQLIFMPDAHKIALDFDDKRVFYNQIIEIETEEERDNLENPANGTYYFVIKSAVLWAYWNGWIPITSAPEQVLFIGMELPELGSDNKIYVNKSERNISVWDKETSSYLIVGEKYEIVSEEEIDDLFEDD